MKRPRPITSSPINSPSTPPPQQTPLLLSITRRRRTPAPHIAKTLHLSNTPTPPNPSKPTTPTTPEDPNWKFLNISSSELFLPLTFPTGQTFRWRQTGQSQYTGVVKSHLFSLKQFENDVGYFIHSSDGSPSTEFEAKTALEDYLNLGISLGEMWGRFSEADPRFAELARHVGGARVLRQDPFECLFQFLCSSNNNIQRITGMVGYISSFGSYLGNVGGMDFHAFPSLGRLSMVSEEQFRKAGFGYRAKYIVGAVKALQLKLSGGEEWLLSLRDLELQEVIDALCALPGVGPKVAACIALFSLDQHHAIPVDTHVWQIATRYLVPELAGASLTPKLCGRVSEAFVSKFGKYAGWAQTVLFIAELPSQKALLPPHLCPAKEAKSPKKKHGKKKGTVEG